MRAFTRRLALAALGLILALGPAAATAQDKAPVTVFAAASLNNVLNAVGTLFTARTGTPVRFSFAASSTLARQIEAGAPAEVFVSADSDWMAYLDQRHLIVGESRRDILTNHLALIAPADSKVALKIGPHMPLVQALNGGRLAVAGPDVPAGKYGKASLTAPGVWPSVQDHLAQADSVRGALAFVAHGEAPLGVVYDTDAKVEPKVRIVGLFPDASHPPIIYPAALVKGATRPGDAAFLGFLQSPEAAAVFRQYGFVVLPRPNR
jgi:molybdate transport system substrate-binding protein